MIVLDPKYVVRNFVISLQRLIFFFKYEMRVLPLVRDISLNSQYIKNSSLGIGVHSSVTKMQQSALIFAMK